MPDQNDEHQPGHESEHQPWREARHQPEPEAIEGHHAGRRVPEEQQRHDSGVGNVSQVEGEDSGDEGHEAEGAFGEQGGDTNANPLSDYRDAGIAKNELGPSGHDNRHPHADRTQGGTQ